jgi:alkylation response protein AidB-like acyl-CoA dehydrogenase
VLEGGGAGEPVVGERYWAALTPDYLTLRQPSIYGGTNEIQKNIIATVLLG